MTAISYSVRLTKSPFAAMGSGDFVFFIYQTGVITCSVQHFHDFLCWSEAKGMFIMMEVKMIDIGNRKTSKIILKKYRLTRILESWVEIHTTVDKAWDALVDFESWTQWNSFIPMVKGEFKVGNKMMIKVKSPGLKEMNFKPTVFKIESGKKVVWGGGALLIGYKGIHEFIIESVDEHLIRFKQIEKFEGPIVLFMNEMINKTAIGYVNMNEEFKDYLEKNQ